MRNSRLFGGVRKWMNSNGVRARCSAAPETEPWFDQASTVRSRTDACAVSAQSASLRSDGLIGIDVVNSDNENLGSVEDVLLNPKTGEIAYLVIGRGGVFGIDEKYVPVPWNTFKMAGSALLLVLDSSKANMDAAPRMKESVFAADVNFGRDNQQADDYWKTRVPR